MNKFSKILQNKLLKIYPEIKFNLEDGYYGEGSFRTKTDKVYILYMLNDVTKAYELRIEPIVSFNKWSQAVYQREIGKSNVVSVLNDLKFIEDNIKTFCELSNRYCIHWDEDECNLQEWYEEVSRGFAQIKCLKCGELVFIDTLIDGVCLTCDEEEEEEEDDE